MMTVFAGCTSKTGNIQNNYEDSVKIGMEKVTEDETLDTEEVPSDETGSVSKEIIKPDEENLSESGNIESEGTYVESDDIYNDPFYVYPDGSVDIKYADGHTVNSDDFTSSEEYVYIVSQFAESDHTLSSMYDIARSYPQFAEGDYDWNVTKDITLPKEADGVNIEWISSDESILSNKGVIVNRPHEHSKYVMLTAILTKDEYKLVSRYIVKVTRDMYDNVTEDMILGLSEDYENINLLWEMGIDLAEYDGWFYWCDELEQLYFFQDDLDSIFLTDDPPKDYTAHVQCTGKFFEVKVETLHEAYLAVSSLRSVTYCDDKYELRFDGHFDDIWEGIYDFGQYYNGVPTNGFFRLGIDHDGDMNFFNSYMVQVPDGFDTKAEYSMNDMIKDYDLLFDPELNIYTSEKFGIALVWIGYTKNFTCVIVDAKTGDLLSEASTIITN